MVQKLQVEDETKFVSRSFEPLVDLWPPQTSECTMSGTSKGKGKNRQTRFPVARIKRIMQKDEEVGKVAQATPVVICACFCVDIPV